MSSEQNITADKPEKAKPKFPEPGQLWTVPQIARKLQLSQSTIIRMITAGSIPALCVRSGKRKDLSRTRGSARKMDREPGTRIPALNCELKESTQRLECP